jgi:drug/metabolite transporter (DMT)-like permease
MGETQPHLQTQRIEYVGLLAAMLMLDGFHFVFARLLLAYISPGVSVLYVIAISTLEIGLVAWWQKKLDFRVLRGHAGFFLAIGFLVAASTNINYEAVAYIDPGTASLLSQMSIVFGIAFGLFWMHDQLSPRQLIGAALAVIGVFIIAFQKADYLRFGSLLVLASAFMYAIHAALTKRYGGGIDFLNFFFGRLLCTTLVLFCFSSVRGALAWPTWRAWPWLVLVGTVDVVLSRTLYYIALRRLTMSLHTLVLTLSPVVAVAWAWIIFRTLPTAQQAAGGLAVIAGMLLVTLNGTRPERKME